MPRASEAGIMAGPYTSSFADVLVEELAAIWVRRERVQRIASQPDGPPPAPGDDPRLVDPAQEWADRLVDIVTERDRVAKALIEARVKARGGRSNAGASPSTDTRLTAARRVAMEDHLAGLALSGGGIRSATFCIGVLQGLASLRILRFFDYLSTVSGGGYAGGWLAAWIAREGDPINVEKQLPVSRLEQARADRLAGRDAAGQPLPPPGDVLDDEPEPIRHLRQYSSYLNPQPGLFSIDTWAIVAIYTRNVLINLLAIVPVLMLAVLLVREVVWGFSQMLAGRWVLNWLAYSAVTLVVVALVVNVVLLALSRPRRSGAEDPASPDRRDRIVRGAMVYGVIAPVVVAAALLSATYRDGLNTLRDSFHGNSGWWISRGAALAVAYGLLLLISLPGRWLEALLVLSLGAGLGGSIAVFGGPSGMGGAANALAALTCLASGVFVAVVLIWRVSRKAALGVLAFAACSAVGYLAFVAGAGKKFTLDDLQKSIECAVTASKYLSWPNVVLHGLVLGLAAGVVAGPVSVFRPRRGGAGWMRDPAAAVLAGTACGVLLTVSERMLEFALDSPWLLATIGPPLFLLDVVLGLALYVGLLGSTANENEREWWGRLAALLLIAAVFWAAGVAISVYGPALLYAAGSVPSALLALAWAGLTTVGVRMGSQVLGGPAAPEASGGGGGGLGSTVKRLFLASVPTLFLVGLLMFVALLVAYLVSPGWYDVAQQASLEEALTGRFEELPAMDRFSWYFRHFFDTIGGKRHGHDAVQTTQIQSLAIWAAILAFVAWLASSFVDVNLFSLHSLYANRLTRTFLGASRRRSDWRRRWPSLGESNVRTGGPTDAQGPSRTANPFTGFDPSDEIDLFRLCIGKSAWETLDEQGRPLPVAPPPRYWGPHLVLNTALNLVAGEDLAWRDRKAESFALTPLYCGSRSTGYARVKEETSRRLQLGRSVALSGAAVDPNMNQMQSASMTVLLTIFNARLGAWIENPDPTWGTGDKEQGRGDRSWQAQGATAGYLLFKELLGNTHGCGEFVHLSDGGHFENLGVYELVRRRCRYIVAVDATENPNATSDNLGILVRLCRVDFGVRVELNTEPLAIAGPDGRSRAHVVIGTIHYEDVDGGAVPGVLVYLRASMTGDEPPDVQQYRNIHPEFPRQLTLTDQSFDEDQFESYRALGDHIARVAFGDAAREVYGEHYDQPGRWWGTGQYGQPDPKHPGRERFITGHRRLFRAVRDRWSEAPPGDEAQYFESARSWIALQRDLRRDPNLAALSRELYPERPATVGSDDVERAELHAVEQMLQVMAEAWVGEGLNQRREGELSRGWMNTFRRLANTPAFRRHWPALRAEFTVEFVRFCEQQLRLGVNAARLVPVKPKDRALAVLGAEFAREWHDHVRAEAKKMRLPGSNTAPLAEIGAAYLKRLVRSRAVVLPAAPGQRAAWLIVQTPAGYRPEDEADLSFVRGLLVIHRRRRGGANAELFAWVRPAHRGVGIGADIWKIVEVERDRLLKDLGGKLIVRYPRTIGGPSTSQGRSEWLSFFTQYGFAPRQGKELVEGEEWVLELG